MSIEEDISKLCRFAARYSRSKVAFKTSVGEGVVVVQLLENLAKELSKQTDLSKYRHLQTSISKGQGNLPRVFWIGIVPQSRTVSTSISVAVCFGRNGEGIVAGLMLPKAGVFHTLTTVKRTNSTILVDVDGDKPGTKYNDCFINPIELQVSDLRISELIVHLNQSLKMLSELTQSGANGYSLNHPVGML